MSDKDSNETSEKLQLHIPHTINNDSWLQDDEFKWFREGWNYAQTQQKAITPMCKLTPEEAYNLVMSIVGDANGLKDKDLNFLLNAREPE